MTITLRPDQEQVLKQIVELGLATNTEEAVDQAFDTLRERLPGLSRYESEEAAGVIHTLEAFGRVHQLSLGGISVKQLLEQSRP